MKRKRVILFAGLAALVAICVLFIVFNRPAHWEQLAAALQSVPRERPEAAVPGEYGPGQVSWTGNEV